MCHDHDDAHAEPQWLGSLRSAESFRTTCVGCRLQRHPRFVPRCQHALEHVSIWAAATTSRPCLAVWPRSAGHSSRIDTERRIRRSNYFGSHTGYVCDRDRRRLGPACASAYFAARRSGGLLVYAFQLEDAKPASRLCRARSPLLGTPALLIFTFAAAARRNSVS